MNIILHAVNFELEPEERARLTERTALVLSRFAPRIDRVRVRIEDLNGPKGGVDHRCQVDLRVRRGDSIVVEALDLDPFSALDGALRRVQRKIRRDIARRVASRRDRRLVGSAGGFGVSDDVSLNGRAG